MSQGDAQLELSSPKRLTEQDYTYRFPDHWLVHEHSPDSIFRRLHSYYVGRVTEIIQGSGARTVLDVGCGDGWASGQMAAANLDVVGIDWSANAINHARALAPNARFLVTDVGDVEFRTKFPDKFDAIALIEVLEHIPPKDCADALRAIKGTLKLGGTFVLTTPSVNFPNNNPQHYRHFTEPMLRDVITAAGGLAIVSMEGYGDANAERSHYRLARWTDNRYYCIKPAQEYLLRRSASRMTKTPLDRCHGFIVTMKRTE